MTDRSSDDAPMTPQALQELQSSLDAFDALKRREADAYRDTFHWMLGWLAQDRQVSTAEIAAKMQECFDQAVL